MKIVMQPGERVLLSARQFVEIDMPLGVVIELKPQESQFSNSFIGAGGGGGGASGAVSATGGGGGAYYTGDGST